MLKLCHIEEIKYLGGLYLYLKHYWISFRIKNNIEHVLLLKLLNVLLIC